MDHVNTSVLEELIEFARQERQLETFRARAVDMQGSVDPSVAARVIADYDVRLQRIRQEAEPLRVRARAEYQKLRMLYDAIKARESGALLARAELEFRHKVGEIADDDLHERLKQPDAILAECRDQQGALDAQRERFLEAFTADQLAAIPPVASASASPVESVVREAPETLAASVPTGDPTVGAAGNASTPPPPLPDHTRISPDAGFDATMVAQSAAVDAAPAADSMEGRTMILPEAVLIGPTGEEFRLGALNYLGRGEDNQVRVQGNGVSRRHALIAVDSHGFRISDLGSRNGTFVNDEQVTERVLADGDVIQVGETVFRFQRR